MGMADWLKYDFDLPKNHPAMVELLRLQLALEKAALDSAEHQALREALAAYERCD